MRRFCLLKRQKLRPEGGLPTEEPKRHPRRFLWEARPAANAEVLPAQKEKASPRGRGSYRRVKVPPALLLWEPRPRGESDGSVSSKSQSFAPRAGLLQKSQSAARAASVGAATPRRKRWFCQLKKPKPRPEVGPPTEEPKRRPRRFVGGAPRGECGGSACLEAKASPRVGAPTEEPKRRPHRFCGRRPRGEC